MKEVIDERTRQHYLLEKQLAQCILASSRQNRSQVALEAYNELFSEIPWHSQLHDTTERGRKRLADQELLFGSLVDPQADVLDIGTGTGNWMRSLASRTSGRCVGIDISEEILVRRPDDPPNLEFYVGDAVHPDFPAGSFDIAFSSQLIEHLHPDDVEQHFASVYAVLRENGVYAFATPSRLDGPHDVSKHFDVVATGFHLKEWTFRELAYLLEKAGFRSIQTMILPWRWVRRLQFLRSVGTVPVSVLKPGEKLAERVRSSQTRLTLCKLLRIAPIYIVARRGG